MGKYVFFCTFAFVMSEEINRIVEMLSAGITLLYPTDTIWGVGCDATNEEAVERIYSLKQRDHSKSMLILCADVEMVERFVAPVNDDVRKLLIDSARPTTVIMSLQRNTLASNLVAADGTIGVRIPRNDFCQSLLRSLGKPLVSTSANLSGRPSPRCRADIDSRLCSMVDYCVPEEYEEASLNQSSRIVRIDPNGEIIIIRE